MTDQNGPTDSREPSARPALPDGDGPEPATAETAEQRPAEQAQPSPQQPGPETHDPSQPPQQPPAYAQQQPLPPYPQQGAQQPYPPQYAQQPYAPPVPNGSYPGQYPGQPPAGQAPRRGVRPWIWWVIGGGAVFIALIVVGVVLLFALLGGNGAKAAAESYLSALAKGDATSANRLAHVNTAEHDNAMLTNSVLSSAKAKITDAKVTRTASSRSSDLTYVYVTYSLGGTSYHDTMQLQKDAKGWYVREGLTYRLPMLDGSSSSSNAGYSVKGSSTAVTVDDYGMVAYPGLYEATSPNQFYTLSESVTVTAAPDAATTIKGVSLTPSQKYVDAVQKQVDAHYDKCATLTDYYQIEDCGIELGFPDNVMITGSRVAVKIGTHPKVSVDDSDSYNQFKLDDGSFSATITGETYDGGTGSEQIEAGAGYASADITIKDGKVVVTFD